MNQVERVVIVGVVNNLRQSTIKDWERGDIDDWAVYGKIMRSTIDSSITMLNGLTSLPTENTDPIKIDNQLTDEEISTILVDMKHILKNISLSPEQQEIRNKIIEKLEHNNK